MCSEMPPSQHTRRINLQDLKTKIIKILGPGRAGQYFGIIGQFFSCKLSKAELDRQVLLTVEREYLSLHNQLIWAIWTNATSNGAPPPPLVVDEISKLNAIQKKALPIKASDYESSPQGSPSPGQAVRPNGCIVTGSPRKGRSGIRDRKAKEKLNVPAIHFKGEVSTSREAATDEGRGKGLEDGVVESADLAKRLENTQDPAQQPDNDHSSPLVPHAKRPKLALPSRMGLPPAEGADEKNPNVYFKSAEEAVKEETSPIWAKTEISAPLGVPFCVGSTGAAVKVPTSNNPLPLNYTLLGHRINEECSEAADLPDVDSLQRRMELIALSGGLEGVSYECAVCLNQALDIHLKQLITACTEFVRARCSRDEQGNALFREKEAKRNECLSSVVRLSPGLNGIWPNHPPSGSATVPVEAGKDKENHNPPITPIDFKVTIENKPQQLGENWPTLLERLSFQVFEQQDKQYLSGL
ncbi:hypothetical protein O6H91_15G061900 [Diphasiastrum complanatum]|uniref:Uncharacterized protein n=2 Tax=Diphasiastrum complanatum TaxID=34168 RepID=A0ACC2BIV0_DIPCM|nr:hypothetical protein O6H91_Y288700 [Diphasiastrum complanatum]KAJ7529685.1 hypothetical protein O6H91_15G061900 [Diphasiastrum complanatum]KAJ7529686.1 hypothetical protein O6H91_15G061900 [Diphasiastrum complanatum]